MRIHYLSVMALRFRSSPELLLLLYENADRGTLRRCCLCCWAIHCLFPRGASARRCRRRWTHCRSQQKMGTWRIYNFSLFIQPENSLAGNWNFIFDRFHSICGICVGPCGNWENALTTRAMMDDDGPRSWKDSQLINWWYEMDYPFLLVPVFSRPVPLLIRAYQFYFVTRLLSLAVDWYWYVGRSVVAGNRVVLCSAVNRTCERCIRWIWSGEVVWHHQRDLWWPPRLVDFFPHDDVAALDGDVAESIKIISMFGIPQWWMPLWNLII